MNVLRSLRENSDSIERAAACDLLSKDKSVQVRREAIDFVGDWVDEKSRAVLEKVKKNDKSPTVRHEAERVLQMQVEK